MESINQKEFSILAKLAIEEQWDFFPDAIYDKLPSLLKDSCKIFNEKRERDIFLSGALAVLGGCFHNVYAYNEVDKKLLSPNLFVFVIAPPASGKRALQYSKKFTDKISTTFNLHSIYTETNKSRRLYIPANISTAGMVQILDKNDGAGITLESEIDTLINSIKQDWGNYTDIIRNAFENESYSMYRKGENTYLEIKQLKLSMAISGTESQFKTLIKSVDNGLFSRGCYYIFKNEETTLMPYGRMNTDIDLNMKFDGFARVADNYYRIIESFKELRVTFTEPQMAKIKEALQEIFDIIIAKEERGFEANVKRGFSVALKIATVLTVLQNCEEGTISGVQECTWDALVCAMAITLIFLIHAGKAYNALSINNAITLNNSQQRLYYILPDQFSRDEAIKVALEIGLKERTAYNSVNGLVEKGWIILQFDGSYKKQL